MRVNEYGKVINVSPYQYGVQYRNKDGVPEGEIFDDNITSGQNMKDVKDYLESSYAGSGYDDGSLPVVVWVKKISLVQGRRLLEGNPIDKIRHDALRETMEY